MDPFARVGFVTGDRVVHQRIHFVFQLPYPERGAKKQSGLINTYRPIQIVNLVNLSDQIIFNQPH